MGYDKEYLINARGKLFNNIVQYFLVKEGIEALFVVGSIAAGTADEFSDIDLRVVVSSQLHQQFVAKRLSAPLQWGEFLYNEWLENAIHCVSHFQPFNKVDVFYLTQQHLQPSPWYSLPIQVVYDPKGLVAAVIEASKNLTFIPSLTEIDRTISKGLACAQEVYRQVQRGELFYAHSLLDQTRFYIIQADDYLLKKPPYGFSHSQSRASKPVIDALCASYSELDKQAILANLTSLFEVYRVQVICLHNMFSLERDIESDLYSIDKVMDWCQQMLSSHN